MGKWSQFRCNCPNRLPLPNSAWCDRPYQNRSQKRLSSKQKKAIEDWQEKIERMYECGHRDGMLVQLCPSNIIELGNVIERVFADHLLFETYPKVGDWRNYFSPSFDEELHVSPAKAELWMMEAIELEQAFLSQENISYDKIQQVIDILLYQKAEANRAFMQRIQSVKKIEFSRVVEFLEHLDDTLISRGSILQEQLIAIAQTKQLCQTAIESGNPIEMLW